MANEMIYQSIFQGEQIDARLTAVQSLQEALAAVEQAITAKYTKPASGIPETDLDEAVQSALAKARSAVQDLSNYYTKTEIDALLAAVNSQQYVDVTALPTASADTLGKIYLVGPDANNQYARYYTSYDGSAYSWVAAGTTEINLALYATKAELSQLGQEVGEIQDVFDSIHTPGSENLLNGSTIEKDCYYWQGVRNATSSYSASDFIPVTPGEVITSQAGNGSGAQSAANRSAVSMRYVDAYDANKQNLSSKSQANTTAYTVPSGVAFIRVSTSQFKPFAWFYPCIFANKSQIVDYEIYVDPTTKYILKAENNNEPYIRGLIEEYTDPMELDFIVSKNLLNPGEIDDDCYYYGGTRNANTNYSASGFIPVKEGDIVTLQDGDFYAAGRGFGSMRFVDAYDANKQSLAASSASNTTAYTVPSGVAFVRVSASQIKIRAAQHPCIFVNQTSIVDYQPYRDGGVKVSRKFNQFKAASDSIATGGSITTDLLNIGKDITITAEILGNITSVSVGIAYLDFYGWWVEITPTEINVRQGSSGNINSTFTHGLTLGTKTKIIIDKVVKPTDMGHATIRLIDDYGNIFSQSVVFGTAVGRAFVRNGNSSGTIGAALAFGVNDIAKKIWILGDSYCSIGDDKRWPTHAIQWGYLNYLMNAVGGAAGPQVLANFVTLLSTDAIPTYALWLIGMNGGADDNGAVNAAWLGNTQAFISICNMWGITPIIATIPTVPTQIHTKLNEWVKNSGERYIDFAAAVEQPGTNTWRGWGTANALLSSDEVHPTAHGAVELASRVLVDFPEITISQD